MTISKPVISDIRVGDLTVDPSVQRHLNTPHVSRMQQNYDRAALGTITVSARQDGTFHVIDGQNRRELVRRVEGEDATIPAVVYFGLSTQEEAQLFRQLNTFTGIHSLDKFRVRLMEHEPVALELESMLAGSGWRVSTGRDRGCFSAVVELERIYNGVDARLRKRTPDAARRTIETLTLAWGNEPNAVRSELIGGLGRVFIRHPEIDAEKVAKVLASSGGPMAFVSAARARVTSRNHKLYDSVASLVVEGYNKGRRSSRLPAWGNR